MKLVEPAVGYLACGDTGAGKMPEPEILLQYLLQEIAFEKDMEGLKVLVTAGPTQEAIDPVRYITNHSSGKMGYALAQNAARRGADVTLVTGQTSITPPLFTRVISVISAQEMFEEVVSKAGEQDIIIKAAAVADYRPTKVHMEKIKKNSAEKNTAIELERTPDILEYLGQHKKEGQILCGFSMETQDLLENSQKKLQKKHADLCCQ